jgi:hypothetical protein
MDTLTDTADAVTDAPAQQPDILRDRSRELFAVQNRGGSAVPVCGPRDELIAEVPTGIGQSGSVVALIRRRSAQRRSIMVLQLFRPGPRGVRVPLGSALMLHEDVWPIFGDALADLFDQAAADGAPPRNWKRTAPAPAAASTGVHPAQPAETPPKPATEAPFVGFAFEGDAHPEGGFSELAAKT